MSEEDSSKLGIMTGNSHINVGVAQLQFCMRWEDVRVPHPYGDFARHMAGIFV